jgi:peptidase A4-like protein
MINYTTDRAVSLNFTAPPGTVLQGNSAEWVVKRPTIGGSLSTLANYVADYFSNAYASDFLSDISQPGAPYPGLNATPINMTGNGSSDVISCPVLLGSNGIWFRDGGSAN